MRCPALVLVLVATASGCFFGDGAPPPPPDADPCGPRVQDPIDPAGERLQWVVDSIDIPGTPTEVRVLGLDLDGDPQQRADNLLGDILTIIASLGEYDLDAEAKQLIDDGEILHLIELQAVSLDNAQGVGLLVAHGLDTDGDPTDNFSGVEPFARAPERGEGLLAGDIVDGVVSVDVGTVPIAMTFPGLEESFVLQLRGARIEATVTAEEMVGRIGGGILAEERDTVIFPLLAEGLRRIVAKDCPGGACVPESSGALLLELFDHDMNGEITVAELSEDDLIESIFSADVDLFRGPAYAPRCDGVKDSISLGLGFHAVRATFP
jgi:hypothetical protein